MRAVAACLACVLGVSACGKKTLGPVEAERPGTVTGKVVITDVNRGQLPASITISLRDREGQQVAGVTLPGPRDFRLSDIPPGAYELVAMAGDRAPAAVAVTVMAGETLTTVLRLERGQRLEGVVSDREGAPVPLAQIFVWTGGFQSLPAREALTDEQGKFVVDGVTAGTASLMVQAPGFGVLTLDRVPVPTPPLDVQLAGTGRVVRGRAMDGDFAVAGARVVLGGAALPRLREAVTDSLGEFLFQGVGEGTFGVRASRALRASAVTAFAIEKLSASPEPLVLDLVAGAELNGRVMDHEGKALKGVSVQVQAVPAHDCPETTQTDVVGYFTTAALPFGKYQVAARLPGYVVEGRHTVDLGGRASPLVIRLARAARVVGRVLDAQGRPLDRAQVAVRAGSSKLTGKARTPLAFVDKRLPVLPGSLPLAAEAARLPSRNVPHLVVAKTAWTDVAGRFELGEIAAGHVQLFVSHGSGAELETDTRAIAPGETWNAGALKLSEAVVIRGRVVEESGAGIANARVVVRGRDGDHGGAEKETTTGSDGEFRLPVAPGVYVLAASAPGRVGPPLPAVEVTRERAATVTLGLFTANVTVAGRVLDPRGRGLPDVAVTARLASDDPGPALAATITGSHGRFTLAGLPAADLRLDAEHSTYGRATRGVASGDNAADLQFPQPGGVEGEVVDARSGKFLSAVRVRLRGPDGREGPTPRMQGAGFQALGLTPGSWTVIVEAKGYAALEQAIQVPPGSSPKLPSLQGVKLALSPQR